MAVSFKGAHFPEEIILTGVRWYVAYPLQPSPRHPLLWWGMNSTVFGKYPLDRHPEPHGA